MLHQYAQNKLHVHVLKKCYQQMNQHKKWLKIKLSVSVCIIIKNKCTYKIYAMTPIDHTSTAFPYGFCASTSGAEIF